MREILGCAATTWSYIGISVYFEVNFRSGILMDGI